MPSMEATERKREREGVEGALIRLVGQLVRRLAHDTEFGFMSVRQ